MKLTKATCLGGTLLLAAMAARGARPLLVCSPAGSPPQSPRNVDPGQSSLYNGRSSTSIVSKIPSRDSIVYRSRPEGPELTLLRCDQHYHFPIETPQGCPADRAAGGKPVPAARPTQPGDWIEVHTVYAAVVSRKDCLDENLKCCLVGPFVVRGFSAKVTSGGNVPPIIPPIGRPLAEWSGSNTGPDQDPKICKPLAVQWSFQLGCGFEVPLKELPGKPHGARPVQSGDLVSKDLTLVVK
ncbi:MAG TPA: hypothetical protein VHQ90_03825 [Thermoanaerobaculia bacterium]|nr:hypothetical protein [Thermoanaerobaculia bacterium]